jgi:hypothetical protein
MDPGSSGRGDSFCVEAPIFKLNQIDLTQFQQTKLVSLEF